MAIDISDLLIDKDFQIKNTDKYKAYNLLRDSELVTAHDYFSEDEIPFISPSDPDKVPTDEPYESIIVSKFYENPSIGINISDMFKKGLDSTQIEMGVIEYLTDFGVKISNLMVRIDKKKGIMRFKIGFTEDES